MIFRNKNDILLIVIYRFFATTVNCSVFDKYSAKGREAFFFNSARSRCYLITV